MTDIIKSDLLESKHILEQYIYDEKNVMNIKKAGDIMVSALEKGKKIIACGNGGSMCDAMHFAEELTGRFREDRPSIRAIAISDSSHITCTANDYGFDHIFSRYVESMGNEGDVLLAISTSGKSENVINAALAARSNGMKVIGLTGSDGSKLTDVSDIEIRAPKSLHSDRIQEIHIKVIHILIHYIENNMKF
jgi:D-sedoheptulose 7-phosphate isomerase